MKKTIWKYDHVSYQLREIRKLIDILNRWGAGCIVNGNKTVSERAQEVIDDLKSKGIDFEMAQEAIRELDIYYPPTTNK